MADRKRTRIRSYPFAKETDNILRIGLELEFHEMILSYRQIKKDGKGKWWPDKPMEHEILEPRDPGNGFRLENGDVNWESNWGFRGVRDGNKTRRSKRLKEADTCIIELATAAVPADDVDYWIASHQAAVLFRKSIERLSMDPTTLNKKLYPDLVFDTATTDDKTTDFVWYPLRYYLEYYNYLVHNSGLPPTFQLQQTPNITALSSKDYKTTHGCAWEPYVTTGLGSKFCDVQVNYQMPISKLWTDFDKWISLWNSVWIMWQWNPDDKSQKILIDPNVHVDQKAEHDKPNPTGANNARDIQFYSALFRAAREYMKSSKWKFSSAPDAPDRVDDMVRGLLLLLLVVSIFTVPPTRRIGTYKNNYPQYLKTSPASIACLIQLIEPKLGLSDYFRTLTDPEEAKKAVKIAQNIHNREAMLKIVLHGLDPRLKGPYDLYPHLLGDLPPAFRSIWRGSLDPEHPLTKKNEYGYSSDDPFHLPWVDHNHTSYPAHRFGKRDVKILLESRFSNCKLNMGFNPYVQDFLFGRCYIALLRFLYGGDVADAADVKVSQRYPKQDDIQQDYTNGRH